MANDFEEITTIDLFCGAGGFSIGFENAGYTIISGIDNNEKFKSTYEFNHKNSKFIHYNLLNGVLNNFQKGDIDFIIGSPPCQGFSDARGNRDEKNEFHKLRNSLPFKHIDWVDNLNPEIALLENVSGMATKKCGKRLLLEFIIEEFRNAGYKVKVGLLNSVYYGVPQERIRVFCLAYKEKYKKILDAFPFPLPVFIPNHFKKRKSRKRIVDLWYFEETNQDFFPKDMQQVRNVYDAISDLPINPSESKLTKYITNEPLNGYQKYLRNNNKDRVSLHHILKEPTEEEKIILQNIPEGKIYRSSRFGDRYIGVWDLYSSKLSKIERLLLQFMCRFRTWNDFKTKKKPYTEGYILEKSFKSYKYMVDLMLENAYFNEDQANKWYRILKNDNILTLKESLNNLYEKKWLRIKETPNGISYDINTKSGIRPLYLRLHRNLSSRTILTQSFRVRELVHPTVNRPITFREGARIQSFPDDFEFIGNPNEIATMIGNAVPPLLARELGRYYKKILQNIDYSTEIDLFLGNLKARQKILTEFH